jgi:hypothetical protein
MRIFGAYRRWRARAKALALQRALARRTSLVYQRDYWFAARAARGGDAEGGPGSTGPSHAALTRKVAEARAAKAEFTTREDPDDWTSCEDD